MPSSIHWLDPVVAFLTRKRRLFAQGFGDERVLARVARAVRFEEPPGAISLEWSAETRAGRVVVQDGSFAAPVADLPREARVARVRSLAPAGREPRAVYVVLASSGDEGYDARVRLYRPLVEEAGVRVVLLENAFYGARRPAGQDGTSIRTVADHLLMNLSMIEEGRALVEHFAREGHACVGIAGYSMGGSMAAVVAAVTPRPIAAAVMAAGLSGVPVFNEGLLSRSVELSALGGPERGRARLAELFGAADLDRHPPPRRPEAAVLVGARRDGYVRADQIEALAARWRGSELVWLDTGHAGALVRHGAALRAAALRALDRLAS